MTQEAAPWADAAAEPPMALGGLIGFHLRRAHTLFALHWQLCFRDQPVRITPVHGGMLLAIENQPGLSQAALARIMDVEGPTLVQAVDRLEEAGLIQRFRRAEDRRSYSLQLTAAGREALLAVKAVVPHREAELLCDLTDAERRLLLDMLQRVLHRAHAVTDRMAADVPARPARPRKASPG